MVYDNIAYRPHDLGWPEEKIEQRVWEVLEFAKLSAAADALPKSLAGSPRIMLYDSACSGLDPIISRRMMREIIRQRDIDNVSSIYVTQNPDEVRYLCSHLYERSAGAEPILRRERDAFCLIQTQVLTLSDGHIIFDGEDELFWNSSDQRIRQFLT